LNRNSETKQSQQYENTNLQSQSSSSQQFSLVGTAEYVSPEALNSVVSPISDYFAADLWALGCIIYRFFEGKTPFSDYDDLKILEKISLQKSDPSLVFSKSTPEEAKDLITNLLKLNGEDRLGYKNIEDLKKHIFFNGIDFQNINNLYPPNDSIVQMLTTRKLKNSESYSKLKLSASYSASKLYTIDDKIDFKELDKNIDKQTNRIIETEDEFISSYTSNNIKLVHSDSKKPKEKLRQKKSNFQIKCKYTKGFTDDTLVLEGK
jgi:serine/threonine protein kinase